MLGIYRTYFIPRILMALLMLRLPGLDLYIVSIYRIYVKTKLIGASVIATNVTKELY
jgi:hypothetical protein